MGMAKLIRPRKVPTYVSPKAQGAGTESGVTELIFAEIRLVALCKKYLLTRSEQLLLQQLREGSGLVPKLSALEEPDFMQTLGLVAITVSCL